MSTDEISSLDEIEIENAIFDAIETLDELQAAGIDTSGHELRH